MRARRIPGWKQRNSHRWQGYLRSSHNRKASWYFQGRPFRLGVEFAGKFRFPGGESVIQSNKQKPMGEGGLGERKKREGSFFFSGKENLSEVRAWGKEFRPWPLGVWTGGWSWWCLVSWTVVRCWDSSPILRPSKWLFLGLGLEPS